MSTATRLVPPLLGLLLAACGSSAPHPKDPTPAPSAELPDELDLAAVDRALAARVEAGAFVGLSVAIMRDGEIVFAKAYGVESVGGSTPVGPHTLFAIGSVTKQLVCAAALSLQEDGALSLDDPVSRHYPALTRAADITLLDGLHHVAGYPDYYPLDFVVPRMREPIDVDAIVSDWGTRPLDFEPRSRWSYSNTGYVLVGRVIERVTGKSLADVLAERIFEPLGMTRTLLGTGELPDGAAVGHDRFALGDPERTIREGAGWLHAAGGVWSTPSDLMKWNRALVGGQFLAAASYDTMTRGAILTDGRDTAYGCGIGVSRRSGETVLSHGGSVNGYVTYNAVVPRTRSAVAIMTNDYRANPAEVGNPLLELVIEADQGGPRAPQVDGPPAEQAALALFRAMQSGAVDRSLLSEDFNAFLTDDRIEAAAPRLAKLGEPTDAELVRRGERGGMEVAVVILSFKDDAVHLLMYRTPDGTIHELIMWR